MHNVLTWKNTHLREYLTIIIGSQSKCNGGFHHILIFFASKQLFYIVHVSTNQKILLDPLLILDKSFVHDYLMCVCVCVFQSFVLNVSQGDIHNKLSDMLQGHGHVVYMWH